MNCYIDTLKVNLDHLWFYTQMAMAISQEYAFDEGNTYSLLECSEQDTKLAKRVMIGKDVYLCNKCNH